MVVIGNYWGVKSRDMLWLNVFIVVVVKRMDWEDMSLDLERLVRELLKLWKVMRVWIKVLVVGKEENGLRMKI